MSYSGLAALAYISFVAPLIEPVSSSSEVKLGLPD